MNACINKPMILMCVKWRGEGCCKFSHSRNEMRSGVYSENMLPVRSDAHLRGKTFPKRYAREACHLTTQELRLIQQTCLIVWSMRVVTWIWICALQFLRNERFKVVRRAGTRPVNYVANGN